MSSFFQAFAKYFFGQRWLSPSARKIGRYAYAQLPLIIRRSAIFFSRQQSLSSYSNTSIMDGATLLREQQRPSCVWSWRDARNDQDALRATSYKADDTSEPSRPR